MFIQFQIDCDFEHLFPTGANGFEKLKTLALQLKPYIEEKASDPSAERFISLLSHTSEGDFKKLVFKVFSIDKFYLFQTCNCLHS